MRNFLAYLVQADGHIYRVRKATLPDLCWCSRSLVLQAYNRFVVPLGACSVLASSQHLSEATTVLVVLSSLATSKRRIPQDAWVIFLSQVTCGLSDVFLDKYRAAAKRSAWYTDEADEIPDFSTIHEIQGEQHTQWDPAEVGDTALGVVGESPLHTDLRPVTRPETFREDNYPKPVAASQSSSIVQDHSERSRTLSVIHIRPSQDPSKGANRPLQNWQIWIHYRFDY